MFPVLVYEHHRKAYCSRISIPWRNLDARAYRRRILELNWAKVRNTNEVLSVNSHQDNVANASCQVYEWGNAQPENTLLEIPSRSFRQRPLAWLLSNFRYGFSSETGSYLGIFDERRRAAHWKSSDLCADIGKCIHKCNLYCKNALGREWST